MMKLGRWRERDGGEAIVLGHGSMSFDGISYPWIGFDSSGWPQMYTDGGICHPFQQNSQGDLTTYIGPLGQGEKETTQADILAWMDKTLKAVAARQSEDN